MNRFYKLVSIVLIAVFLSFSFTGCYGNFTLTKKLYNWNGQVGDKFVNSAVMWIMFIVPVYEVAGVIDFVILNTIQFWTGKNPVAMQEGEKETQIVQYEGESYEVTATKNRFDIKNLEDQTKAISLVFNEDSGEWIVTDQNANEITIAQLDKDNLNMLRLFYPDGHTLSVNLDE